MHANIHCANMAPDYYLVQPQFGYNELEWSTKSRWPHRDKGLYVRIAENKTRTKTIPTQSNFVKNTKLKTLQGPCFNSACFCRTSKMLVQNASSAVRKLGKSRNQQRGNLVFF